MGGWKEDWGSMEVHCCVSLAACPGLEPFSAFLVPPWVWEVRRA